MTWNYRLVRMPDALEDSGYCLVLCEVFYGDDGKPDMRDDGASACGSDEAEVRHVLAMMQEAFDKPVLDDFVLAPDSAVVPEHTKEDAT